MDPQTRDAWRAKTVRAGNRRRAIFNALECRDNYSVSFERYEVGTLAVDEWAVSVTFGTARRGLGGAAARPAPSLLYQM